MDVTNPLPIRESLASLYRRDLGAHAQALWAPPFIAVQRGRDSVLVRLPSGRVPSILGPVLVEPE